MRLFNRIHRCAKLTNFYRKLANDVKSNTSKAVTLQVVGSGALGESPSVCLSANNEKYLFNCGEDCYRLLIDQKTKISSIKHILVTQIKWNCIGGISCLSKEIKTTTGDLPMFHGPKQLYKSIKRILCLSILSELDFKPIDCNPEKFYENDILRIDFISVKVQSADSQTKIPDEVLAFVGQLKPQQRNSFGDSPHNHDPPIYFLGTIEISF